MTSSSEMESILYQLSLFSNSFIDYKLSLLVKEFDRRLVITKVEIKLTEGRVSHGLDDLDVSGESLKVFTSKS